jgi:peptidyl-tRNA hydrolase, PTH1 family
MKIIAGLGNPGYQYEATRHNVGFMAIDHLVDAWKATGPRLENRAEVWQAEVCGEKVLLMKPQTFMNRSGRSIAPVFQFYKLQPSDLIVIHDELDLPPVTLRVKTGGGNGGHNGLRSIEAELGKENNDYHRLRIGIGKPATNPHVPSQMSGSDFVLGVLTQPECDALASTLDDVLKCSELLIQGKAKEAMNEFNRKEKKE